MCHAVTRQRLLPCLVPLVVSAWAAAVGIGFSVLWGYSATAGPAGKFASLWPHDAVVRHVPGQINLVMLVHPRCFCTSASLSELREITRRASGKINTRVLMYEPEGASADWRQTRAWNAVQTMPGVEVLPDPGGVELRRFGGRTSGQVLLYDAKGRLQFDGGITAFRGHAGDNPGRRAVLALLAGQSPAHTSTDVFGCPLD